MISAAENSNKFQKTRFWKEKSVEDVVTLGPMAQATLVYIITCIYLFIYIYFLFYLFLCCWWVVPLAPIISPATGKCTHIHLTKRFTSLLGNEGTTFQGLLIR